MKAKRISYTVSLLLILLITGCEPAQPTEVISFEDSEIKDADVQPVVDEGEIEPIEEPSLPEDVEPPLDSTTKTADRNALELTEIQYLGKGNINEIAWSPNGSPIALATSTGIYLIDPETHQEIHFSKPASESVAFSNDGNTLASAEKKVVILRELETGNQTLVFEEHTDMVYQVAFSPVDDMLASASQDGTIKLWDLEDGELINTLDPPGTFVYYVAFSSDGKTLISEAYDQQIILWDVESGAALPVDSEISGSNLAVSPIGESIAVGGYEDPLRIVDFNGDVRLTLDEEPKPVRDLIFSPDGKILASACDDTPEDFGIDFTLKLWDTKKGELLHTLENAGGYLNITFSPDGTQVAAAAPDKVKLWDVESGQEIGIITDQPDGSGKEAFGNSWVYGFAWSPDGNLIALATYYGVSLIDINTHEEIVLGPGSDSPLTGDIITFSPDGKMLAVSLGQEVKIYDVESQEALLTLNDFGAENVDWNLFVVEIAFSPEGNYLATGSGGGFGLPGSIRIWDLSSGTVIREFGEGHHLTFNQEGDLLATVDGEGQVCIWNFPEGTEILSFYGISGYGGAIAFSPDGRFFAVGGAESTGFESAELHLFDASSGELILDFEGHQSEIISLAFNADGSVLASASWDGTVRLWDVETGQQLAVLNIPGANSVGFSPDGTLLATAGYQDVLRIWSMPEMAASFPENLAGEESSPLPTSFPENLAGEGSSPLPALALVEDFSRGTWSPDGRYYFYSQQGPIDELSPDQADNTLYILDTQTGEICPALVETLTMNVSDWGAYPEDPFLDQRTFWMADQRLLYLSTEGQLRAITPCSETIEDWTERLPEPVTSFYSHSRYDQTQLLLNGESGPWLFTPSTGQSVKVDLPASIGYGETRFSWSPYETKLVSSRFAEREDWFGIAVEDIDITTGEATLILELPIKQEELSDENQHVFISWLTKDLLNLSQILDYSGNHIIRDLVVDISSKPEVIADVYPDLFGIEALKLQHLTSWGFNGHSDGQNYYFVVCEGFLTDGQFYLYSSETGSVETYSLNPPKLLVFPNGSFEIAEVLHEKSTNETAYQVIQVSTDRAPYDLQIQGTIPGQTSWSKVATLPGKGQLLIATDQGISLIELESGETLRFWVLENQEQYDNFCLIPSPDEQSVIVQAWSGSAVITAIFHLHLDN